ncbi:MAG: hypothetical protein ACI8P0_001878 [Planctomycetaceae bacterium]|jgi:hypothetical protein
MKNDPACNSAAHQVSRRSMLGNMLAGAAGVGAMGQLVHPLIAKEIEANKKQVLIFLLNGGLSQFESFDPKPNTIPADRSGRSRRRYREPTSLN